MAVGTTVPPSVPTTPRSDRCIELLEQAAIDAVLSGDSPRAASFADKAAHARCDAGEPATWTNPSVARRSRQPVDRAGEGPDPRLGAAQLAVRLGDLDKAQDLAADVLADAAEAGDRTGAAIAALTLAYAGDVEAGDAALAALHREALEYREPDVAATALAFRSRLAWAMGDPDAAIRLDEQALREARSVRGGWLWTQIAAGIGMMRAARGELDAASAMADDLKSAGDPLAAGVAELVTSLVEVERGDPAGARARLEPLLALVRGFGVDLYAVPVLLTAARAEVALARPERAAALLDEAEAVMWSPIHEQRVDALMLRAVVEVLLHAPSRAPSAALVAASRAAGGLVDRLTGPVVRAAADHLRALVARREGAVEDSADLFERAATAWEAAPRWALAAEAWAEAADVLVEVDGERATLALEHARSIAERRGFSTTARRVTEIAERVVVCAARRGPLAALTAREAEVVTMAAAGRTNQEIGADLYLSAITVRNYLSSAFAKLGVKRRAQLAPLLSAP